MTNSVTLRRCIAGYAGLGTGTAFKHLYAYELTGKRSEETEAYLKTLEITELPQIRTLADTDWDGPALTVDDEGSAVLSLGPDASDIVSSVSFMLFRVDEENDSMLLLGTDNDITADWENGVFRDNFRGVWGSVDGCPVYMELYCEGAGYNLYAVPVLLNSEACNLQVVYDFESEAWSILGAVPGLDDSGMAAKEIRLLQKGDVITTIWKLAAYSGEEDFQMYTAQELTVTAETAFAEMTLPDGRYAMVFMMEDAVDNTALSEAVLFDAADGAITTTVIEE